MPGVTLRRLGEGSNGARDEDEAPDTMDLLVPPDGVREIDEVLEPPAEVTTLRDPIRYEGWEAE